MIFMAFVAGMIIGGVLVIEWALCMARKEKGEDGEDESI